MSLPSITTLEWSSDDIVLTRVDFNVPFDDGKISNNQRIVEALPTIKYALEKGGVTWSPPPLIKFRRQRSANEPPWKTGWRERHEPLFETCCRGS